MNGLSRPQAHTLQNGNCQPVASDTGTDAGFTTDRAASQAMPRSGRAATAWRMLVLSCVMGLSVPACTKEEPAPAPAADGEKKDGEKKEGEQKPAENTAPANGQAAGTAPNAAAPAGAPAAPSLQPTAWATPAAPTAVPQREGSPIILAQFTGNALVPVASKHADKWGAEEVITLDKLPEGKNGKDAAPEVLVAWWNRLDLQAGDKFELIGSKGARGTFVAKRELASADRGGCMGLVIAVPGTVSWVTRPAGSVVPQGEEPAAEQVWAVRAPFKATPAQAVRALTDGEKGSASKALELIRTQLKSAQQPLANGVTWQECDSLNSPTCKGREAGLITLDLEGNGLPDLMATVQVKASNGSHTLESRVLLGVQETSALELGKWSGSAKGGNDENLPQGFAGSLDLTGDGRQELIFHRTMNETENWTVVTAGDKPGQWTELLKTNYEGC